MVKTGLKTSISTIFFLLIIMLFMFLLFIRIYDQDYLFNQIENQIKSRFLSAPGSEHKSGKNKPVFVINIEDNISSHDFLFLLYFLMENKAESVFIKHDFDLFEDKIQVKALNDFIRNQPVFAFLLLEHKKGMPLFNRRKMSQKELKNFSFLSTKARFFYAHYLDHIEINNVLDFPAQKVGALIDPLSYFDRNNIDLLYKLEERYLLSLPLLSYAQQQQIELEQLIFRARDIQLNGKKLYYDQKARMSIKNHVYLGDQYFTRHFKEQNYQEWEKMLQLRREIITIAAQNNIFESSNRAYNHYLDEEKFIMTIYNQPELEDPEKNRILESLKEKAQAWNSYKNVLQDQLTGASVFIVKEGRFLWIKNYLHQLSALQNSRILFRLPLLLLFLINYLVGAGLILLFSTNRKLILNLFKLLLIIIFGLVFYLFLRNVLRTDFSITFFLLITFICPFFGLGLRVLKNTIWQNEVANIYQHNISKKFKNEIAHYWRKKHWDFEIRSMLTTFMLVDTSIFLQYLTDEEHVETVSQKNFEIENKIKANRGVIDMVTPQMMTAYFGVPPLDSAYILQAIETAFMITQQPVHLNGQEKNVIVALHTKYEWFKLIEDHGSLTYHHYGTSFNILPAMVKVARLFEAQIIISANVYKLFGENNHVRMLDKIKIPNVEQPIRLFELLNEDQFEKVAPIIDYFHAGLKLFESKSWEEASAYFKQCLKYVPDDIASEIYLQRCKDFIYVPPMDDWDGIYEVE